MKRLNVMITDTSAISWEDVPKAAIDSYVWGGADRAPKACGQLVYAATGGPDEGFYVHLKSDESNPVSVTTEHNGPVWEDSCLEIFFTLRGKSASENGYINIECNSNGVTLIAYGRDRHERRFIVDMGIPPFPVKLVKSSDGWEVFEFVPLDAVKKIFGVDAVDETCVMAGNFYKCDENAGAPFGSWSPVDTHSPDFHRPEFFGSLVLTK